MSTLAMILTVAMVVPASGPEKVSGAVAKSQRLDLSGVWKGTARTKCGASYRVRIDPKVMFFESEEKTMGLSTSNLIDQGDGKLLFKGCLGLYRCKDDLLLICVGDVKNRPPSIGVECGLTFILHRVKPRE